MAEVGMGVVQECQGSLAPSEVNEVIGAICFPRGISKSLALPKL